MRIAIVGCNEKGREYIEQLSTMDNVQLVGLYDLNPATAEKLSKSSGVAAFTSLDQMLVSATPDLVCVTLDALRRKEYVLKAAENGAHIICERPIALSLKDAQAMIDACNKNGVKLFVRHAVRFSPEYTMMRDVIKNGAIGNVGVAHINRTGPRSTEDGGVMTHMLLDDIDYVRSVLGEVEKVYAFHRKAEGIDHALVTLRFRNRAIVNVQSFQGHPGPWSTNAEFAGSNGILYSDGGGQPYVLQSGEGTVSTSRTAVSNPLYEQLSHFLSCIQHDSAPTVTVEDAYKALQVALAAIESADSGVPVTVSDGTTASAGGRANDE